MSKFIKNISLFLAGMSSFSPYKTDAAPTTDSALSHFTNEPDAVALRPLNRDMDNLFAAHRSHSSHASHASHASHYSGSTGGGYVPPVQPATPAIPAPQVAPVPDPETPARQPVAPSPATSDKAKAAPSSNTGPGRSLTWNEKLELQVTRVQIKLARLGLYEGPFDGVFSAATQAALKRFQELKKLPEDGLMTTRTLNALEIPAVN